MSLSASQIPAPINTFDSTKTEPIPRNERHESSDLSEYDPEVVERAVSQDDIGVYNEKAPSRKSAELRRTTSNAPSAKSNVLSRVASRMTTHSIIDPGPPPDGGFQAWLHVLLSWFGVLATWGWISCFGVFQTYYTITLTDVSPSAISWIGTIQNFLTFFIGAFSGRLLDAGYFFPTVLVGVTLQVLAIFMMSLCTQYWQLLLTQGVLAGIGGGIAFTPCMGVLATYFSKRRSFAMGVASTGNSAGGLVYPVIVRQLLPEIGFAWTVRVIGFVNLILLGLVVTFMRPRLPPRKSGALFDFPAFKETPFALFAFGLIFQVWCIYFVLYYVGSFGIEQLGMPFSSSTILLILVNGVGVIARLLPGYFADRFGQLNTLAPLTYCFAIVAWSWLAVRTTTGLYVFVCVYGFAAALCQCLLPPTVASLTDDLSKIGTRLGMIFACMGVSALTGPPIGGALIAADGGSYVPAQVWAAGACTIGAIVNTFVRMTRAKWKWKVKV